MSRLAKRLGLLGRAPASGLAYAIGGPLLNILSPRAIFILAGAGVIATCLLAWLILPRSLDNYRVQEETK